MAPPPKSFARSRETLPHLTHGWIRGDDGGFLSHWMRALVRRRREWPVL